MSPFKRRDPANRNNPPLTYSPLPFPDYTASLLSKRITPHKPPVRRLDLASILGIHQSHHVWDPPEGMRNRCRTVLGSMVHGGISGRSVGHRAGRSGPRVFC